LAHYTGNPSYLRTARVEEQISELARLHRSTEQQVMQEHIFANQAIKRLLEPDEIAATSRRRARRACLPTSGPSVRA
jgi:hypothetical protein